MCNFMFSFAGKSASHPHSAIVDGSQTRVSGPRMVNLLVWFDNEWGFANRMIDVAGYWLRK